MSWHTSRDPGRAGLPVPLWPPGDRQAWDQAQVRRSSPFRKDGGSRHAAATVAKAEKGLRRWLGFLHRDGRLDAGAAPAQRLTTDNLDAYFEHLRACGDADRTVVGYFEDLQLALELMLPGQRFARLTRPNGTALQSLLDMKTRPRFVPGCEELLAWAEDLFREGLLIRDREVRCCQVRDAVLVGILATRAPRLRALSCLRLGVHAHCAGVEWVLDQHAGIVKTKKALLLPLSAEVGAMLDRYVGTEREDLLRGRAHDALWIGRHGTPVKQNTLAGRIWRLSERRFGVAFGPHRMRASLTTTSASEDPDHPLDAPAILGHSHTVSLKHYNRASAFGASRRHASRLRQLRQESEHLARRAYGYDLGDP